jgi:hypothetical protein
MRPLALGLALLAAPALAQPPIPPAKDAAGDPPSVPTEIKVPVGRPVQVVVPVDTTGYHVTFPQAKCRFVRLWPDDPKTMVFEAWPFEAGRYTVVFWKVGETKGTQTDIVAGDPAPPTPPVPVPNPYRVILKAAFDADPGETPDKTAVRKSLAELYDLAATMALAPPGDQLHVTTTDQLRTRLRAAAASLAQDQCAGLRTSIANILAPALPLGATLTDESRRAAAVLFRQVSEGLSWEPGTRPFCSSWWHSVPPPH